jgi:uncharacterized circularly permuted ATP-grasp superfamily protein
VPGLLTAYRAGRITIANAIGTGVADDKSIYPYVPDMIRFYLGQAPIIGNVHTWMLRRKEDQDYVLAHLARARGQGGPRRRRLRHADRSAATKAEIELFRQADHRDPERYIAQPTLALSTCPTFAGRARAAPHRPAPLRALGPRRHHRARRPHARGAARRVAGRQFLAGRRHQGHLGAGN